MPGVRAKGQTLIGCWCDEDFVKEIDEARGSISRSQFARDALLEKLVSMGIHVLPEKAAAPDRAGKGGARRGKSIKYPPPDSGEQMRIEDRPRKKS